MIKNYFVEMWPTQLQILSQIPKLSTGLWTSCKLLLFHHHKLLYKLVVVNLVLESFRFDYEYDYDYEIRHFWRELLASSRADVIKS